MSVVYKSLEFYEFYININSILYEKYNICIVHTNTIVCIIYDYILCIYIVLLYIVYMYIPFTGPRHVGVYNYQ